MRLKSYCIFFDKEKVEKYMYVNMRDNMSLNRICSIFIESNDIDRGRRSVYASAIRKT